MGDDRSGRDAKRGTARVCSAVVVGAAAVAMFASTQRARAADSFWETAAGGNFSDGINWSTNPTVPGSGDRAVFDNAPNTNGTVSFSGNVNNQGVDARGATSGTVALDLNGSTYTLNSTTPFRVGQTLTSASKLVVSDGIVRGATESPGGSGLFPLGGIIAVGQLGASNNELEFSGGVSVTGAATGAPFFVGAGAAGTTPTNNILRITGAETTFLSNSTSTATVGQVAGTNGNALIVSNGASVTYQGSIFLGAASATPSPAATNLIEINNATYTYADPGGNRGINIRDGIVRVTNGATARFGFLSAHELNAEWGIEFNDGTLINRRLNLRPGSTFTIGDGGANSAVYRMDGGSPFMAWDDANNNTIDAGSITVVLNDNAELQTNMTGGTRLARIEGSVSSLGAGAAFTGRNGAPQEAETLQVNGNWNSNNLDITLKLGDFPTQKALDDAVPQTFAPPQDFLDVNGLFTHGNGTVTIDLQHYVAPTDQDYVVQMIAWNTVSGTAPDVTFINGPELFHQWLGDGLYVTAAVPEPATMSLAALAACGLLVRRRRA